MAIPERLYYSLTKALKEINKDRDEKDYLDFEDLFHFAFIGELEICSLIDYDIDEEDEPLVIYLKKDIDKKDKLYYLLNNIRKSENNIILTNCGSFTLNECLVCADNATIVLKSYNMSMLVTVPKNFFSPVLNYDEPIKSDIFKLPRTLEFSKDDELYQFSQYFDFLFYEQFLSESYKNLFITKQELEIFKNGGKEVLPIPRINKTPAPKTINAQAEFIKALITANYGAGVANNIRWNLDFEDNNKNKIGCIRKHFQDKGLAEYLLSGKTVENWIKDIELNTD